MSEKTFVKLVAFLVGLMAIVAPVIVGWFVFRLTETGLSGTQWGFIAMIAFGSAIIGLASGFSVYLFHMYHRKTAILREGDVDVLYEIVDESVNQLDQLYIPDEL